MWQVCTIDEQGRKRRQNANNRERKEALVSVVANKERINLPGFKQESNAWGSDTLLHAGARGLRPQSGEGARG